MICRTLILGTVLSAAALLSGAGALRSEAPAGTWNVDPVHSSMIFRVKHMNTSYFYGNFNEVTGSITMDDAKPEASSMDLSVKIESLETHNSKRNGHLKSPDFFDAAKYPTATFKSTA